MTEAKVVLKVSFVDESFKSLAVNASCTAKDLATLIAEKISLTSTRTFALFYRKDEEERCLEDTDQPCQLIVNDARGLEPTAEFDFSDRASFEALKKTWEQTNRFIFKRRIFLRSKPPTADDQTFLRYSYLQAVSDITTGNYPCKAEDAVTLAGLQMQVNFGDHNATKHTVGFLKDKLPQYVPSPKLGAKQLGQWESEILSEHSRLVGTMHGDAMLRYLNFVRSFFFYGSTFWTVKPVNEPALPSQVILAVNSDGIIVLKPGTKELIQSHSFSDVYSWAYKKTAFAFMSGTVNKVKFQFETTQGKDIARTLQAYVEILLEEYKADQKGKQDQTPPSSAAAASS